MDGNTALVILFGFYLIWHIADLWFANRREK